MLTTEQFDRTRRLASSLAGIELVDRHRELLSRRSQRLGIRDDAGLDALLNAVAWASALPGIHLISGPCYKLGRRARGL